MRPGAFGAANRREQPHAVSHANRCTSFRHHAAPVHPLELREQLKHDDLVHLMYDAAHNTASRATRWTEIDRKKSACNARCKGRALGDVPAVRGDASWYPRAPTGSPRRRDRDRQIPKPALRIGAALDRPSTRLGERSSKTRCLVCRSMGKCSNLLSPALQTAFRPFCPDRHPAAGKGAPRRFTPRSQISWRVAVGLGREGQKRALSPAGGLYEISSLGASWWWILL